MKSSSHAFCSPCRQLFRDSKALAEHYAQSDQHFYCSTCDEHFEDKQALEQHYGTSSNHIYCLPCHRHFTDSKARTGHYIRSGRHIYCKPCSRHLRDKLALESHHANSSSHTYCLPCRQLFTDSKARTEHYATSPSHYFCRRCNQLFLCRGALDDHLKTSLSHFPCPKPGCDFDGSSKADLLDHWKREGCVHPCKGCSLVCSSKEKLSNHLGAVNACRVCPQHNDSEEKLDEVSWTRCRPRFLSWLTFVPSTCPKRMACTSDAGVVHATSSPSPAWWIIWKAGGAVLDSHLTTWKSSPSLGFRDIRRYSNNTQPTQEDRKIR